jgi:hypothetical protein
MILMTQNKNMWKSFLKKQHDNWPSQSNVYGLNCNFLRTLVKLQLTTEKIVEWHLI